jgi:hypothetical protein
MCLKHMCNTGNNMEAQKAFAKQQHAKLLDQFTLRIAAGLSSFIPSNISASTSVGSSLRH